MAFLTVHLGVGLDFRRPLHEVHYSTFRFKFFIEFSIGYTIHDYGSQCYYKAMNIIIRNKNDDICFSSTFTELFSLINSNII